MTYHTDLAHSSRKFEDQYQKPRPAAALFVFFFFFFFFFFPARVGLKPWLVRHTFLTCRLIKGVSGAKTTEDIELRVTLRCQLVGLFELAREFDH